MRHRPRGRRGPRRAVGRVIVRPRHRHQSQGADHRECRHPRVRLQEQRGGVPRRRPGGPGTGEASQRHLDGHLRAREGRHPAEGRRSSGARSRRQGRPAGARCRRGGQRAHRPGHTLGDRRQGGLRPDAAHAGADREPDPARGPQRGRGRPGRGLSRREPERRRGRPQAREGGTLPEQGRNARRGEGEPGARAWRAGSRAGGGTAVNGTGATLLRAECLTKSYAGRRVVCDVSIEVHAGEVVGLLGPNGAGKTTTFYMIVGLTRPDAGTVFLNGEDVTALPMYERARRGVSYLPQEPSVFRKLTVEENIRAILETLDLSPDERAERCRRLLDELGIARLARNKAYSLY